MPHLARKKVEPHSDIVINWTVSRCYEICFLQLLLYCICWNCQDSA